MSNPILVKTERKEEYMWVTLPGILNMDNCLQIEEQIHAQTVDENLKVVVDLAEIQYVYSSVIGLLIRLKKRVVKNDGSLWLVNVNEKCKENIKAMNLDSVFTVFATDLEFELSQDDIWQDKLARESIEFICVQRVEDGLCRINLSGSMMATNDLSSFSSSIYTDTVSLYVIDLTGLDMVDSRGAYVLFDVIMAFKKNNAACVAYGANEALTELLDLMGVNELISLYQTETEALKAMKECS